MKKINLIIAGIAVMLMISITSCKKFLDVNNNENLPTTVNPKVLLPSAEASIAYSMGGDASRYTAIFMQYVKGYNRQFFGYDRYIFTEEDFNNLWNNLYADGMKDANDIINYADAHKGQYSTYQAMARIIMAYSIGLTSDMWGDIPYSDAFKGLDAIHPKYDTQDKVYQSIKTLLDQAIDSLTNGGATDIATPYEDDFFFNGDVASWVSLAQGLKARFDLHLTKVNGASAYNAVLADLTAGGLTSTSGDCQYNFNSVAQSPWYQYINNRDDICYSDLEGQVTIGAAGLNSMCTDSMVARHDPRYGIYIDTVGDLWGAPGYLNAFYGNDNSPVIFFTYAEQKFIEAEAKLMTGDNAGAQSAYTAAITADMTKKGVAAGDIAAYLTAYGTLAGTQQQMLQQIIYEKYVSLYLQTESWCDYRRLNNPLNMVPNAGVLAEIPRRFIYPTNEKLYNPNIPTTSSSLLSPRLWWDN